MRKYDSDVSQKSQLPRQILRILLIVVEVIVVGASILVCLSFSMVANGGTGEAGSVQLSALVFLSGLVFGIVLLALLPFRRQFPVTVTFAASSVAAIFMVGLLPVWCAVVTLVRRTRGWRLWAGTASAFVASLIVVWRDTQAPTRTGSLLQVLTSPASTGSTRIDVPFPIAMLAGVIPLGLAIGIGAIARVMEQREVAEARSEKLGNELTRSEERNLIAREIHDGLGHRLSLLSLQAGALEAQLEKDPELAQQAAGLRSQAAQSMDDLREVLDVVGAGASAPQFTKLAEIVDEWAGHGVNLSSTIFIHDAESAPPTVARAVVRIVQESLTNAKRHAPGHPIRLRITGGPGRGIDIDVRNTLPPMPSNSHGGRRGLVGMDERVRALGGVFHAGVDGSEFRVSAQLPWNEEQRRRTI